MTTLIVAAKELVEVYEARVLVLSSHMLRLREALEAIDYRDIDNIEAYIKQLNDARKNHI